MIQRIVLAFAVENYLLALPRPVLRRAVSALRRLESDLNASPSLISDDCTRKIDTETVSISFFVDQRRTLNILRVSVVDTEATNVIWLLSRKKFEASCAPQVAVVPNKRRASQHD